LVDQVEPAQAPAVAATIAATDIRCAAIAAAAIGPIALFGYRLTADVLEHTKPGQKAT
jgi:hypothetical protein